MGSLFDVTVMFNYEFVLIFCSLFLVGYVAGFAGALITIWKNLKEMD